MKVKQIATILNTVINAEQLGESAIVNEDLSNIVDVGKALEASGTFGDNFDNFMKALIDRIGKTIFVDRVYKSQAPNIMKDGWEYGSALQKVRCDLPDATENKSWTLADLTNGSTIDPFVITKPTVSAKYFNSKTTFEVPMTFAERQVKEAFKSATELNRLFSMIENRINMKMTLCTDAMIMRTINNLIANKIHSGNGVVNILSTYNTKFSKTLTPENCLVDSAFLKYLAKDIMMNKKYLGTASMLYNDDGFVTFTPEDKLKIVMNSEVAKDLEVYLYADTYNKEFVSLAGYSEVPYWQGSGTTNTLEDRTTINIKAINPDGQEFTVQNKYVIGVMFDEDAAMVCNQDERVTSIYNPKGEYWNYFYKFDCSYLNDLAENCIVYVLKDKEA